MSRCLDPIEAGCRRSRGQSRAPPCASAGSCGATTTQRARIVPGEPLRWPELHAADFYPRFLRSCFAHLNGALFGAADRCISAAFRTDLLTSEDYDFTLRVARGQASRVCDGPTFISGSTAAHEGRRGQYSGRSTALRKFADGDAEIGHQSDRLTILPSTWACRRAAISTNQGCRSFAGTAAGHGRKRIAGWSWPKTLMRSRKALTGLGPSR